jgi:hypothetical protein
LRFGVDTSLFAACVIPFVVLATLNSGGYRYGASDQAFYLPATLLQLDPSLFPRDAPLLAAQTRLTLFDEITASVVQLTRASLPSTFITAYVAALLLLAASLWRIGLRLYRQTWTCVALLAAFTLRHAIARSGTNTLEGYFHPRVLAFALGAAAVAFFLRRRIAAPLVLVLCAFALHPTTGLWFLVWLSVSAAIVHPHLRRYLAVAAAASLIAALWALAAGPLTGRLSIMDPEWRQMLASKDYLFPLEWPAYAWIINLGYLPVIAWIYLRRARAGLVDEVERGLVLGSSSLAVIFAVALALHAIGVTLAIQLQPARLFWMFDTLAVVYAVWFVAEGHPLRASRAGVQRARLAALLIACFSIARGVYVLVETGRPPLQVTLPDDDWGRVMGFARTTAKDTGWLAHPLHAVLYGTSVRVAGERDVFVEAVKDAALGMYDRDIAVRTAARLAAIADFNALSAPEAQRLGKQFDLDFIITEQALELPLAFESGAIRVYRLQ